MIEKRFSYGVQILIKTKINGRPNEMKNYNMPFIIFIIFLTFVVSCGGENSLNEKAKELDSIESYENFLSKYPESQYALDVRSRIQILRYNQAKKTGTTESYEKFLSKYPNSKYDAELKERILILNYEQAKKDATKEAYKEFLRNYPNSKYTKEIKKLLYPHQRIYNGKKITIMIVEKMKKWSMGMDSINAKKGEELIIVRIKDHIRFSPIQVYDIADHSYKVMFKRYAMSFSKNNKIEKFSIYGFSIPQDAVLKKLQLGKIDFDLKNIKIGKKYK